MLSVLLLTTTTFPGGTANEFAKFLGDQTKRNVVIAQAYVRPVEKAEFYTADFEQLTRQTRAKTHLRFLPGPEMILQDELLPPSRMTWTTVREKIVPPKWVEVSGIKGGVVTFDTKEDERVDPTSLEKAAFSKPVSMHWMLGKYALAIHADQMPERKFLEYVAKAAGGSLRETAKGYRLDLDPDQLKKRALNMIALNRANDPLADNPYEGVQARIEFITAILQDATRADLLTAFATPDGEARGNLGPNSETYRALVRVAKSNPNSIAPQTGALRSPAGPIFLDKATKAQFVLRANFTGSLELTFPAEGDKPGPFIRFEIG